jgi:hypothetical protein
MERETEKK